MGSTCDKRPSIDEYFLEIARVVASRSTCARRAVGCVLVDSSRRILSTGYNGSPPGERHCIEQHCPGASAPSGKGLDLCAATHAEINALLYCPDIREVDAIYLTVTPCLQCIKALLTTSARRIVAREEYANEHTEIAKAKWINQGREWKVAETKEKEGTDNRCCGACCGFPLRKQLW